MTAINRSVRVEPSRSLAPLQGLIPYVFRYRTMVAGAAFSLMLAAAMTLTLPLAVGRMIDRGFSTSDSSVVANYFMVLGAIAAVLALGSAGRYYFVVTLGERVVADIRRDVFAHVTKLSPSFFDTAQSGEIVARLTADATQVKSAVGATASVALRNVILLFGAVAMMVVTSPKLSALVIAAIPLMVLPLVGLGRSVRRKSRAAHNMLAGAMSYANEQIGSIRTLQSFTNERLVTEHFSSAVETAFEAARSSVFARSILTFIAIFTIFSSVVAVLWFGSRDVLAGMISPGTLGQFLLYSVFAAGALGALSEVWGELSQAAGAAERLTEILSEEPVITASANPKPMPTPSKGLVEFRNVSFSYAANPNLPALRRVSFSIMTGETVAIVGASGAGKSTVFSLLMRFYDPQFGSILIDGVDIREAIPEDVRRRLALVPQDVTIFAATVRENIGFGRPEASREDIEKAASEAVADEFIARLEKGLETSVGERGVMLSGGQRQRIAIARAILRDAPILLLDEATSALDAESEMLVQTAVERSIGGRTTIVIAHRLATVLRADRILVMHDGQIVEEGTHRSLVAKGGMYARVAKLQFDTGTTAFLSAAE